MTAKDNAEMPEHLFVAELGGWLYVYEAENVFTQRYTRTDLAQEPVDVEALERVREVLNYTLQYNDAFPMLSGQHVNNLRDCIGIIEDIVSTGIIRGKV